MTIQSDAESSPPRRPNVSDELGKPHVKTAVAALSLAGGDSLGRQARPDGRASERLLAPGRLLGADQR